MIPVILLALVQFAVAARALFGWKRALDRCEDAQKRWLSALGANFELRDQIHEHAKALHHDTMARLAQSYPGAYVNIPLSVAVECKVLERMRERGVDLQFDGEWQRRSERGQA